MRKSLSALLKRMVFITAYFIFAFFAAVSFLPAQDSTAGEVRWYRSNSSGMALELIPSRLGALRHEYGLSVRNALPSEIPVLVLPHFNSAYRVELRTIYKKGIAIRFQWIFRDGRGITRLIAAGSGSHFAVRNTRPSPDEEDEKESSGFIEIRNNEGDVTREFQFNEDLSEWDYRYFYRGNALTRAEIWFKGAPVPVVIEEEEPPEDEEADENAPPRHTTHQVAAQPEEPVFALMFTDTYRYTRSGSLRAIDRRLHTGALERLRRSFPRLGPGVSLGADFITQGSAYSAEYFVGVESTEDVTISYNLDTRGRLQGEVWRDDDGEIIGELINTWSGERLQSILWKSVDEERLIEFEYDSDGNRTVERNFVNGVLERSVIARDGIDVEELFINGRLVLRAFWENGVKISEERIPPPRSRP